MRYTLCLLLMILLPLHSVAVQDGELGRAHSLSIAHEIDHLQGNHHHHAADGTVQYDDSEKSVEHALEHSSLQQAAALPSTALPALPISTAYAIAIPADADPCDGFPDRPQRPPCALG